MPGGPSLHPRPHLPVPPPRKLGLPHVNLGGSRHSDPGRHVPRGPQGPSPHTLQGPRHSSRFPNLRRRSFHSPCSVSSSPRAPAHFLSAVQLPPATAHCGHPGWAGHLGFSVLQAEWKCLPGAPWDCPQGDEQSSVQSGARDDGLAYPVTASSIKPVSTPVVSLTTRVCLGVT